MKTFVSLLAATFILSWPAFLNGYPFIFPDTAGYLGPSIDFLATGWLSAAWSRPPFYGIFALPIHWTWSLWPLAFVQAFLISHLLFLTLRTLLGTVDTRFYLVTVFVLSLFTSLPWHAATLIPDIFTPIVVLGIFLLVCMDDRLRTWELLYVLVLTTAATSFHFSHLGLAAILAVAAPAMWLRRSFRPLVSVRSMVIGLLPFVLAFSALVAVNKVFRGEAAATTHGSLFLLSRYQGIVKDYLNEHCDARGYILCEHKDDMGRILWGDDSLTNRIGANKLNEEAKVILREAFRTYPIETANSALQSVLNQLVTFSTANWIYVHEDTPDDPAAHRLFRAFPNEYSAFLSSGQSTDKLPKATARLIDTLAIFAALPFFLSFLLQAYQRQDTRLEALYAFVIVSLVANAAVCAALSAVVERYQSRLIWLVVLVTLIGAYRSRSARGSNPGSPDAAGDKTPVASV